MYRPTLLESPGFLRDLKPSRYGRAYGTVQRITKLFLLIALALPWAAVAQTAAPATMRGTVIDARTGAPLGKVLVAVDGGPSTETAVDGGFELQGLTPGPLRLYVSLVGYGLVQRTVQLLPGMTTELRIPLSEGTATYTETVTVSADRFRRPDFGVPAQQSLGSADLQNLRGVLADDALRAVQVLPGVATGDDFRSEFTVRGSDFSHLSFTVDGFATPFLLHMVRAVEERANTGSVTMINSDVLEEVTLSSAGYAQLTGNRTGAELAFVMRDGSRDRNVFRASVSGTSASAVAEGPLGASRKGSWLLSGRKSYLDLLIDRLSDEGLSFGFADVQAKLRYDVSQQQTASLTLIAGRSTLEETPENVEDDELFVGNNATGVLIANWKRSEPRSGLSAGVLAATNAFDNHTMIGTTLENGKNEQFAARADLRVTRWGVELESGALIEHIRESQHRYRLVNASTAVAVNEYRDRAVRTGGYVQGRLSFRPRWRAAAGARVDHWSLTDQVVGSPWIQTELVLPRALVLRAAGGIYRQFADFEETVGAFAGAGVRPETAVHTDISIEDRLSPSTRVQVTVYNRQDSDLIRRPDADTRLAGQRVIRGSSGARYANRLDGYARGIELLVQRSAQTGLSGWVSYSYGRNRYSDSVTGDAYWGDLDQRHTLNAYGSYRLSRRFSVSAKYRMGTNFPIPGYYARQADLFVVSDRRNELRLPSYARLDLRANRTFDWSRKRLTLFAEVINVLNRENVRFSPPRINTSTRQVTRLFDSLIPVVPSAGVLLEF